VEQEWNEPELAVETDVVGIRKKVVQVKEPMGVKWNKKIIIL